MVRMRAHSLSYQAAVNHLTASFRAWTFLELCFQVLFHYRRKCSALLRAAQRHRAPHTLLCQAASSPVLQSSRILLLLLLWGSPRPQPRATSTRTSRRSCRAAGCPAARSTLPTPDWQATRGLHRTPSPTSASPPISKCGARHRRRARRRRRRLRRHAPRRSARRPLNRSRLRRLLPMHRCLLPTPCLHPYHPPPRQPPRQRARPSQHQCL